MTAREWYLRNLARGSLIALGLIVVFMLLGMVWWGALLIGGLLVLGMMMQAFERYHRPPYEPPAIDYVLDALQDADDAIDIARAARERGAGPDDPQVRQLWRALHEFNLAVDKWKADRRVEAILMGRKP